MSSAVGWPRHKHRARTRHAGQLADARHRRRVRRLARGKARR